MGTKVYDFKIEGYVKKPKKEALEYLFYRKQLLRALAEKASWGARSINMKAAFAILEKHKTRKNITLTKNEFTEICRALNNYKGVHFSFIVARDCARNLLSIIDEAEKLYKAPKKNNQKTAAAMKLGWTTGKKEGAYELKSEMFMKYLFEVTRRGQSTESRREALNECEKHFHQQTGDFITRDNIIKMLKEVRRAIKKDNPTFHIQIPGNDT